MPQVRSNPALGQPLQQTVHLHSMYSRHIVAPSSTCCLSVHLIEELNALLPGNQQWVCDNKHCLPVSDVPAVLLLPTLIPL
jgi:hypothetical protein